MTKPPKIHEVFAAILGVLIMVSMFMFMWNGLGFSAAFQELQAARDGEIESPTIDDYEAIESIGIVNDTTVVVTTDESPRFASTGSVGRYEVTHIQVTRTDGQVNERVEQKDGVTTYRFTASGSIDGNYTLTLIKYVPEDPGFLGSPERYEKQHTEFTVRDGELNVSSVPWAAKYTTKE